MAAGRLSQQANHVPAHLASVRILAEDHRRSLPLLELVGDDALHNRIVLLASEALDGT